MCVGMQREHMHLGAGCGARRKTVLRECTYKFRAECGAQIGEGKKGQSKILAWACVRAHASGRGMGGEEEDSYESVCVGTCIGTDGARGGRQLRGHAREHARGRMHRGVGWGATRKTAAWACAMVLLCFYIIIFDIRVTYVTIDF